MATQVGPDERSGHYSGVVGIHPTPLENIRNHAC
jgi:hypothetical protein